MLNRTRKCDGGAIVEFALLVPAMFFMAGASVGLGILAVNQFRLESVCAGLARQLALSPYETTDDLRRQAISWLGASSLIEVELSRHEVSSSEQLFPRDTPPLEVIELTLHRQFLGLSLSSMAWEARVLP